MRALSWLLIRWPRTVALAGIERDLAAELDLRAQCASQGLGSPHQLPPPDLLLFAAAVTITILAYVLSL